MSRVVLINPQIVSSRFGAPLESTDDVTIRHALAQFAPLLRRQGHEVSLIDLRLLSGWEAYERAVAAAAPDWLCVTSHTCEREVALEAMVRGRRVASGARIIAGGIDPTTLPELYRPAADFVLRGEGEISLPRLLESPDSFPAVSYGETPDLDALPFADRELWPDYAQRIQHQILGFHAPTPVIDLIAQRGCPWPCKFCCGPGEQNLYTRARPDGKRAFSFRVRSPDHVLDELEILARRYHFRSIVFHDDQFIVRPAWVEGFCAAMGRRLGRRRYPFWAAIRADVVCRHAGTGGLMEQLKGAGLHTVSIGFESFSDDLLSWMQKGTTADENYRAAEICRRMGLEIYGNFMFGLPRSDGRWHLEDDRKTLEAIRRIRPRVASTSFFSPVPGAPFYPWFEKSGLMLGQDGSSMGQRNADEGKLKGVDYETLGRLLADLRRDLYPPIPPSPWPGRARAALGKLGLLPAARRARAFLNPPAFPKKA